MFEIGPKQWKYIGGVLLLVAVATGLVVMTQEQQQAIVDAILALFN